MDLISPMLAQATPEADLLALCRDHRFAAEQKVDGHRLLMHVDERVFPASRSGRELPVTPPVLAWFEPFLASGTRWVFDGEFLDGVYYLFDLVTAAEGVTPASQFGLRRDVLVNFLKLLPSAPCVQLLPSYQATSDKRALVERIRGNHGEGVIFRRLDAPYRSKRSDALLKVKFCNDVDCVVVGTRRKGKANLVLGVWEDGQLVEIGECTALAGDKDLIHSGDVVTVKYLYTGANGRLVQPTLPRLRRDKTSTECTIDQLVHPSKTVLTDTNPALNISEQP